MEFAYIFTVGCSLTVLAILFAYARKNRKVAGSRSFVWQILFATIWSVGALMEMLSPTEQSMLFWRNFEQLGVCLLPVACVGFAVEYARYDRFRKYLPLLLIVPVVALALIFTDASTHIMRYGYVISYSPIFGKALSVRSTPVGMMFISYNYLLLFVSLIILFTFSRQVDRTMKRQAKFILSAFGTFFLFALLKTALLEGTRINIPIVTLYLPCGLILYYNLYRNNMFLVSPIARDKVFDVVEQGIVVADSLGTVVDRNPYADRLLGSFFGVRGELTGKKISYAFPDYPEWVKAVQNNAACEMDAEKNDGSPRFIRFNVYPLQSEAGMPIGTVTILRDITAGRLQEFALRNMAEMDGLTGLLNRNGFMETFERLLQESSCTQECVSVLMMDLDGFKGINDTFGHTGGDKALLAFAGLLREVLRQRDVMGRLGGDEFAAVLPAAGREQALAIADRIRQKAEERAVELDEGTCIHFTLSIGVCDNEKLSNAQEMLKCADRAMYEAKRKSKNHCVAWEQA